MGKKRGQIEGKLGGGKILTPECFQGAENAFKEIKFD